MSGTWVFSPKSAAALLAFKEAVKTCPKPSPSEIWKEVIKKRSDEQGLRAAIPAVLETAEELNVDVMTTVEEVKYDKICAETKDQSEYVSDLLTNQFTVEAIEEIRQRSKIGDSLLFCISRIITDEDLNKLTNAVCSYIAEDDAFFEKFCAVLLYQSLMEKPQSRILERTLMTAFNHNRTVVLNVLLTVLKSDNPRPILNAFFSSLDENHCKFVLNEILNSKIHDWHLQILHSLYNQATISDTSDVLQAQMINALNLNVNAFAKDKIFGKLLLSVIQKESGENELNLKTLRSICLHHNTAFKKPALAAIDKICEQNGL